MSTFATTIKLPKDLHARAKTLAKRTGMSLIDLIRDGLWDKVTQLEERLRIEEEKKNRDRSQKRLSVRLVENEILAPQFEPIVGEESEKPKELDEDDRIYRQHAEKIVTVYDNVSERRLTALAAIKDICDHRPLTADPFAVERRLHEIVEKIRNEKPNLSRTPLTDVDPTELAIPSKEPTMLERMLGITSRKPE